MTKRIGVLLSGRGSNFEALAESVAAGRIPNAEIAVVISNREGAPGIDRAKARGIAARVIPSKGLERETYDRQVAAVLDEHKVDLICLAGYMRLLSPYFVAKFPNRILNIHPSLLPSFPGLEAQRQALIPGFQDVRRAAMEAGALGCSISGAGPTTFAWADVANAEHLDPRGLGSLGPGHDRPRAACRSQPRLSR